MIKTALAPTATREETWEHIKRKLDECREGISDTEAECLGLAETWDTKRRLLRASGKQERFVRLS